METIGWAVKQLHNGSKVRRAGWNGKGMFLYLIGGGESSHPHFTGDAAPYVAMKTAQGYTIPWLCSQADLLATDWEISD